MFIPRCSIFIPASFGVILLGRKLTHRKVLNYGKQRSDSQRNRSNYRSLFTRKGNIENLEVPVPQGVSYVTLGSLSATKESPCNTGVLRNLQVFFYFLNDYPILQPGKFHMFGIHLKHIPPFHLILIFGNQMKMKMLHCIAISPVIYFVRVECGVNRLGRFGHIRKESVPLLVRQVHQFADV